MDPPCWHGNQPETMKMINQSGERAGRTTGGQAASTPEHRQWRRLETTIRKTEVNQAIGERPLCQHERFKMPAEMNWRAAVFDGRKRLMRSSNRSNRYSGQTSFNQIHQALDLTRANPRIRTASLIHVEIAALSFPPEPELEREHERDRSTEEQTPLNERPGGSAGGETRADDDNEQLGRRWA